MHLVYLYCATWVFADPSVSVFGQADWLRAVAALVVFGVLIYVGYAKMVRGIQPNKSNLGNFVAFNALAATLTGAAVVVVSSRNWTMLLLVAGASLGVGFLFGLLFGYPLSAAKPAAPPASSTQVNPPPPPITARNLFQESADSLSKIIAGATLVQAKSLYHQFVIIAGEVAKCSASICPDPNDYAYGASLTLYFLVLGFLAGLLLPNFYHLIEPVADGDGQSTPTNPEPGPPAPPPTSMGLSKP